MLQGHRNTADRADALDQLFAGPAPLVTRLADFASFRPELDDRFRGTRIDLIATVKWPAQSWHGLLAKWAERLAGYAKVNGAALWRHIVDGDAETWAPPLGDTATDALKQSQAEHQANPWNTDYAELDADQERFANAMEPAVDGFLDDSARIFEGLKLEAAQGKPPQPSGTPKHATPAHTSPSLLTGWRGILTALGLKHSERNHRLLVKRRNADLDGPIHYLQPRVPAAQADALQKWWAGVLASAEAVMEAKARPACAAQAAEFEEKTQRIRQGMHMKSRARPRSGSGGRFCPR